MSFDAKLGAYAESFAFDDRQAVLGIDAAWTYANPSGVSLICQEGDQWALRAVAGSYREFVALPGIEPAQEGEQANLGLLIEASTHITSNKFCCVAVDIPIAMGPIFKRLQSDVVGGPMFGHVGCATHTPTPSRPRNAAVNPRNHLSKIRNAW